MLRGMHTARSRDGTKIAYDTVGAGPPLILVGGAFSYRTFPKMQELARLLAHRFTVINYDRRGRGGSGDTQPYAVEREYEDLDALVQDAGAPASVWGWSSGGILAMKAAAHGVPFEKVAVYEPPFVVDPKHRLPPRDFVAEVTRLVQEGRRSDAASYYLGQVMGVPRPFVAMMRLMPMWPRLKAVAHTLPYDGALSEDNFKGEPLRPEQWAGVTPPTLVLSGEKSPELLRAAAHAIAGVLPNAEHRVLAKQSHNPKMKVMAPVLEEFFADRARSGVDGQLVR